MIFGLIIKQLFIGLILNKVSVEIKCHPAIIGAGRCAKKEDFCITKEQAPGSVKKSDVTGNVGSTMILHLFDLIFVVVFFKNEFGVGNINSYVLKIRRINEIDYREETYGNKYDLECCSYILQ